MSHPTATNRRGAAARVGFHCTASEVCGYTKTAKESGNAAAVVGKPETHASEFPPSLGVEYGLKGRYNLAAALRMPSD